jgi:hypothetical protein
MAEAGDLQHRIKPARVPALHREQPAHRFLRAEARRPQRPLTTILTDADQLQRRRANRRQRLIPSF